jgi:transglutaminase-like putative cysteine protease
MSLATIFRLSLYALTAFASWMLGRAEEGWIPYVTFPVLVVAFVTTESRQNWSLPAWVANLLGAIAVAAAGFEFAQEGPLAKLLSGAHLLVYATWIVMFQEKTIRNYWWLMGLGILQIAVASVQANETNPAFGIYLVLYVCGALWTMCVASLYQAQLQFTDAATFQVAGDLRGRQLAEHRVLQYDGRERWITARLVWGVVALTNLSLLVSAAFFAFTPRMWIGPQNIFGDEALAGGLDARRKTGFAEAVRLGEIGQILESVKPVLRVQTYDAKSQQPVDLFRVAERLGMDEPLFRGVVFTEYLEGKWAPERSDQPVQRGRAFHQPGYRIDFTLEPMPSETLFTLGLPDACRIDRDGEIALLNLTTGVLSRQSRSEGAEQLAYSLFVRETGPELVKRHAMVLPNGLHWPLIETGYLRRNQRLPAGMDRLKQLAREVVQRAETAAERSLTTHEKALAVERHLRDSGQYGYTLNLTVADPGIDPVEDFLFNRREGHCEYFATSLALMLRAVDIPARVVSGFKGAERVPLKSGWEVQERHAHLWVEAWVSGDMWVTLDPTPGEAREQSVAEIGARIWGLMRATTSSLWSDYVVNVNLGQQKRQLYGPLSDFAQKVLVQAQQAFSWGPVAWAYLKYLLNNPTEWLSLTGGLMAFTLMFVAFLILRGGWWLWKWGTGSEWARGWSQRRQQRLVVAFYDRFVKVVRRYGLRRTPTETPREFAMMVVERLRDALRPDQLEGLPVAVCTAYYRVRFGGETLTIDEVQTLEQNLTRFESQLQHNRRR